MSTKQNMYVGKEAEANRIIDQINNCVIVWKLEQEGIRTIAAFESAKAESIRNDVANMQGKLEVLIDGLDKTSSKREKYQSLLDQINQFLELFK